MAGFLDTCSSTPAAWPHEAATIHYHAAEGHSWLLALDDTGARPALLTDDAAPASASATGAAEQPLLFVRGRLTPNGLYGIASTCSAGLPSNGLICPAVCDSCVTRALLTGNDRVDIAASC